LGVVDQSFVAKRLKRTGEHQTECSAGHTVTVLLDNDLDIVSAAYSKIRDPADADNPPDAMLDLFRSAMASTGQPAVLDSTRSALMAAFNRSYSDEPENVDALHEWTLSTTTSRCRSSPRIA
jgi:hypothetical protein